jgi:hypothetical protein
MFYSECTLLEYLNYGSEEYALKLLIYAQKYASQGWSYIAMYLLSCFFSHELQLKSLDSTHITYITSIWNESLKGILFLNVLPIFNSIFQFLSSISLPITLSGNHLFDGSVESINFDKLALNIALKSLFTLVRFF